MSASMPAFQLSLCFSLQSQFYCSISFEFQVVVCVAEASARERDSDRKRFIRTSTRIKDG
jgi:hypothetical protein